MIIYVYRRDKRKKRFIFYREPGGFAMFFKQLTLPALIAMMLGIQGAAAMTESLTASIGTNAASGSIATASSSSATSHQAMLQAHHANEEKTTIASNQQLRMRPKMYLQGA